MPGGSTSGSYIPDTLVLSAYQPNATARNRIRLTPGFDTRDTNSNSRVFETAIVGGTNGVSAESVVVTTRSDYELGADGNLLRLHTVDNFGRDEREYHHEFGFIDNLGNRTLFVRDMLGSTRAVLKNGTMVEWNDYYAYGAVRDGKSLVGGRWQYLGKEFDSETNSLHLDAREYDPLVGFTQIDPLWAKYPSLSPYNYVGGNPLTRIDPTGMDWYEYTDKDGNRSAIWREGNAKTIEHEGVTYHNVGATYSWTTGNTTYFFDQQSLVAEETVLLSEEDFQKQTTPTGCYRTAVDMAKSTKFSPDGAYPYKQGIQVGKETGDANSHTVEPTSDLKEGIDYLNTLIDMNIAPVVGVDHSHGNDRNDKTTDHYVTIAVRRIDYKEKGAQVSLRYFDPGTIRGKAAHLIFTFNDKGLLTAPPGMTHKEYIKYVITHIVLTKQLKR